MKKKGTLSWLILIILVLTWGSSFILMKKGLEAFSALQLGALRIVLVFIFLIPFMATRFRKVDWRKWYMLAICGLIGSGIPAFLFAYAQTGIDSSLTGILNSLTPLFAMILGMLFFGYRGKWYNILGVFIGLAGALGLIAVSGNGDLKFNLSYAVFVMLATLCYAVNLNLVKTYLKETDPISITAFTIGFIGIPALVYLIFFSGFPATMLSHPMAWHSFLMVAILAVFGTGIALMLHNYLLKISSVVFAASVTYLMPVVAIFWGMTDGEPFRIIHVLWMSLVLFGVYLVNKQFRTRSSG